MGGIPTIKNAWLMIAIPTFFGSCCCLPSPDFSSLPTWSRLVNQSGDYVGKAIYTHKWGLQTTFMLGYDLYDKW